MPSLPVSFEPFRFATFATSKAAAEPSGSPTSVPATRTRQDDVNDVLAGLTRIGYVGKKEEDLAKLNDADPYEQELIVMAEVSAYFRIAYKVR